MIESLVANHQDLSKNLIKKCFALLNQKIIILNFFFFGIFISFECLFDFMGLKSLLIYHFYCIWAIGVYIFFFALPFGEIYESVLENSSIYTLQYVTDVTLYITYI